MEREAIRRVREAIVAGCEPAADDVAMLLAAYDRERRRSRPMDCVVEVLEVGNVS